MLTGLKPGIKDMTLQCMTYLPCTQPSPSYSWLIQGILNYPYSSIQVLFLPPQKPSFLTIIFYHLSKSHCPLNSMICNNSFINHHSDKDHMWFQCPGCLPLPNFLTSPSAFFGSESGCLSKWHTGVQPWF